MAKASSQSWILPGLLLLFVLPLMGYAGYTVADRWYQGYQLSQEEAALRTDIIRLREENLKLQAELKDVRGDAFIEGVAREQLGLVKPGDRAIVLVGPPQTTAPVTTAPPTTAPEPAARRPEPAAERSAPPEPAADQAPAPEPATDQAPAPGEPGGWRKVLDALFGR